MITSFLSLHLLNILKYLWMKPYDNWDPEEGKKKRGGIEEKVGTNVAGLWNLGGNMWLSLFCYHYFCVCLKNP